VAPPQPPAPVTTATTSSDNSLLTRPILSERGDTVLSGSAVHHLLQHVDGGHRLAFLLIPAVVGQRFAPLAVAALPHWTLPQVRWFAGPDVLLYVEARTWPWVRARTHQALDDARQAWSP